MRELNAIVAAYGDVDAALETQRDEAARKGDAKKVARIERKQLINDHAYFVLCFGQLETGVDEACRTAIRARQSSSDWSRRRAWDLYNPGDRRLGGLSFEERAALVADKSAGRGKTYARIVHYYGMRNKAAHGEFEATRIEIPSVAAEFQMLAGRLVS